MHCNPEIVVPIKTTEHPVIVKCHWSIKKLKKVITVQEYCRLKAFNNWRYLLKKPSDTCRQVSPPNQARESSYIASNKCTSLTTFNHQAIHAHRLACTQNIYFQT